MKVAFRLSALGFGGTERVFLSVAHYLSTAYGWTIVFVVDELSSNDTEGVAQAMGCEVVSLGAARTWLAVWPFYRFLAREHPDVVVSAYTETNAAALLSNLLTGRRHSMIITEHAALDEHWAAKRWHKRMLLEFMVRHIYRLADHVLCVSGGVATGVRRRLKTRPVTHIYNPVRFASNKQTRSQARESLDLPDAVPMLLAVGRISRQKNYAMLIKAFAIINCKSAQLFIVGGIYEKSEKEALENLIDKNLLFGRIHFINFTHDVNVYYAAADALVLSSGWEGFGNVLVEALAFGLPIVSTDCNHGPAEILEHGRYGELVAVGDVPAMASAIDKVLAHRIFEPAAQVLRAQDFSEAKIGEQYHKLINTVRLAGK